MTHVSIRGWTALALVAFVGAAVTLLACQPRRPGPRVIGDDKIVISGPGGGVIGSAYVLVSHDTDGESSKKQTMILLPDIAFHLHNVATGSDTPEVTTDLFGRYSFPLQPAGRYRLRWRQQRGWASGEHPEDIIVTNATRYPGPVQVRPERASGVLFGHVSFEDGAAPWSYDELFAVNHTATVSVSNAIRTLPLAEDVRANVTGQYAVAGIPRSESVISVAARSEAANLNRAVPITSVSFGNPVPSIDLKLPNRRPEIIELVPVSGGETVKTAPAGDTISLESVTRDMNGDPLDFTWEVLPGSGSLAPAGDSALWTLPNHTGTYSAYLQVADGRGGYARHRIDFPVNKTEATFSGRALNKDTGSPVKSADVSVNGRTATTDANGFFRIKVPLVDRYVLNINSIGFAAFSRSVARELTGQTWFLVPAQKSTVDPTRDITLVDRRRTLDQRKQKGMSVTVPANSLVDSNGALPAGSLDAYIATLNVGDGEGPGDWGGLVNGKETNLLSYGAGFVEFRDSTGRVYNLAPGKAAELTLFPLPSMVAGAPADIPLWDYDSSDGYWKSAGQATFDIGSKGYRSKVTHFSTYNTDLSKDDAACLKVMIYPPIPTGVRLRVSDPTGSIFSQTFEFVLDAGLNAVYRLPANTDVRLQLLDADGTSYDSTILLEEVPGVPLASDIVNTGPAIPAGETLWPEEPYETCKLVILREANEPTSTAFLAFKGAGSAADAEGYYSAVDPDGTRQTLGQWWQTNGFEFPDVNGNGVLDDPDMAEPPTNAVRTSYLNYNDLGSGRDMYFLDRGDGTAAAYVTNYGLFNQDLDNANLAANRDTPGATVCMEYSAVEGGPSTRIVKFFVFAGEDFGPNAPRQTSADLDGFGAKFVPNLCLNCHGGNDFNPADPANPSFAEINLGASFRELDTATYRYPEGRETPNDDEKTAFREQNRIVAGSSSDTISVQPIKDLIDGWYPGSAIDQDNTWTPSGWAGSPEQDLYLDLIRNSCRTCHVALRADVNWTEYDQLAGYSTFIDYYALCEGRVMPHSVITYRNYWLSSSPHQPAVLREYSDGSTWDEIGPCE